MSWEHMKNKPSWNRGKQMSQETKIKISEKLLIKSPKYQAIHSWVRKWGGKATYCEMADETCLGKFEWSNISHQYLRDLNDYQQLCSSHHSRFDKAFRNRERKWNNAHLQAAKAYASLSHAERLKVGAVLIKDNRVIAIGINGTPTGGSNICEEIVNGELVTKPEVIHAESNVICFAAKNGISTKDTTLIVTHSPCYNCSKTLIQAGVKEILYETEYRDTSGIDLLKVHNVKCGSIE